MGSREIIVVGAGPAGLVAAVNLRREGFRVLVREKEKRVGGPPGWHPSAHDTPVAMPGLWDYIGIDCSPCFRDCTETLRFFAGQEEIPVEQADRLYVVERGHRETSLDSFLLRLAEKEGVDFEFGKPFTEQEFREAPENTILATGLSPDAYQSLDIPCAVYAGYWASAEVDPQGVSASIYFGGFSREYGYSSSTNGLWYVLLFSRKEVAQEHLDEFKRLVVEKEGRSFDRWKRFVGYTPREPRLLLRDRLILTGTLAGVVEPAIGFGITGALLSARIAALTVLDRGKGQAEFDRFTRGIPAAIARKKEPGYIPVFKMGDIWFEFPDRM
jgi:flavin-dependent dehydrogenase